MATVTPIDVSDLVAELRLVARHVEHSIEGRDQIETIGARANLGRLHRVIDALDLIGAALHDTADILDGLAGFFPGMWPKTGVDDGDEKAETEKG